MSKEQSTTALARYMDERKLAYVAKFVESRIRPEYLLSLALEEARADSKIARCTPQSFLLALVACAQTGLRPSRLLGEAYLVPFHDHKRGVTELTMVPGWKGLLKLVREAGGDAWGSTVYAGDQLRIVKGTTESLEHIPALENPGEIVGAYAIAEFQGRKRIEYMTIEQLDRVRELASKNSAAWRNFPEEMYRKVVLKRACKQLPLGERFARAMEIDNAATTERMVDYRRIIDVDSAVTDEPIAEDPAAQDALDARIGDLRTAIRDADSQQTLVALAGEIRALPAEHRDSLMAAYRARRAEL